MHSREIVFSHSRVQLLDSNLVKVDIFGDIIDLAEAREMNEAIGMLCSNGRTLVLLTAKPECKFTPGAMKFSSSQEGLQYTIADAIVVRSLGQRLTANFYLRINKPRRPTRIFSTEREAIRWLRAVEQKAAIAAGYQQMGL
jgi:hypothetical protein